MNPGRLGNGKPLLFENEEKQDDKHLDMILYIVLEDPSPVNLERTAT
jgi:hypothetical protein